MAFFGMLLILIGLLDPILFNIFKIDLYFFVELPPIISQLTPVIAVAAGSLLTWLDSKQTSGNPTPQNTTSGTPAASSPDSNERAERLKIYGAGAVVAALMIALLASMLAKISKENSVQAALISEMNAADEACYNNELDESTRIAACQKTRELTPSLEAYCDDMRAKRSLPGWCPAAEQAPDRTREVYGN